MKLQVISDLHLEFDNRIQRQDGAFFALPRTNADVILLAGDIWHRQAGVDWAADVDAAHEKPVVMVFGNHDYWPESNRSRDLRSITALLDAARERALQHRQTRGIALYVLEQESLVLGDVRILGATLWTDYRGGDAGAMDYARHCMVDFELIRGDVKPLLTPSDLYERHRETVVWLDKTLGQVHNGPTVVLSHHAPSLRSTWNVDPLTPAYCSDLEWLVKNHQPALWLHGHTHEAVNYQIGQTRVLSNPRGYYPMQTDPSFDPARVVTVSS